MLPPWGEAAAELVVVANARCAVDSLTREQVINIFLGRYRQMPNGIAATPLDLPETHSEKARFYRLLVNKDLSEIDAYWARLVFSGKTLPPRQAANQQELVAWLARDKGAIAYMERGQIDARLKVVLSLEP
jgi:ABC-type phosphate transport system substrate-binding protein